MKVEFDALGGDDSEFEDSSPRGKDNLGDTADSIMMKVEDEEDGDVEFDSPKGSSMWKKWSRRDGQTENGDVIVTSSPVSREKQEEEDEEFLLNNSTSSRIMKHEMRVLDVDEGNATDDNPDRGFGSTEEFHHNNNDGDITTTDLDMSGEFLGGGVTTGTSLQSTDFDVSDVTSVTALSNASVSVMDSGCGVG